MLRVLKPFVAVFVVPNVREAESVGELLLEVLVGELESVREMVDCSFEREERVRKRSPRVGDGFSSLLAPFDEEELDAMDAVRGREFSAVLGGEMDSATDVLEDAAFCAAGDRSSSDVDAMAGVPS